VKQERQPASEQGKLPVRQAEDIACQDAVNEIAQANQAHSLGGFGQPSQNPFRLFFQKQELSIREKKQSMGVLEIFTEPLIQFAAKQPQDAPDFLQRQSLAPQLAGSQNLQDLPGRVAAAVILFPRRHELALVPPLELAERDAGHLGDIGADEEPFSTGARVVGWKHATKSAF